MRVWFFATMFASAPVLGADKTIAVLDFTLVDEHVETMGGTSHPRDLQRIEFVTRLMRDLLAEQDYAIVDGERTAAAVAARLDSQYVHECNGCELDLGKQLGADWVLMGWVQKVSNLILNLNVIVKDVGSGDSVARAFVDLRGNDDRSWEHATRYLVKNILLERLAEKL